MPRPFRKPNLLNKIKRIGEKKINTKHKPITLDHLPNDILLLINHDHLAGRETIGLIGNNRLHSLLQRKVGEKEAKIAAEYAINPTQKNVLKLKDLLKACPALLLHSIIIKNRHGMKIKATVFQIALHEGDDELIEDVIKEGFKKLNDGEETMDEQRKKWLPEEKEKNWIKAEEKLCKNACDAIDKVFAEFKKANNPIDVTELQQHPYTRTIHNQEAKNALDNCQKAIDDLYIAQAKVIESGRDPSIPLFKRIIDRYRENYETLGSYDSPRNNAVMRSLYGYFQRKAPINFMQAFAQGIYFIAQNKEKLNRSFEYRNWQGHSILPLDSELNFRLGYDYWAAASGVGSRARGEWWAVGPLTTLFFNQKQQQHYSLALCPRVSFAQ